VTTSKKGRIEGRETAGQPQDAPTCQERRGKRFGADKGKEQRQVIMGLARPWPFAESSREA